MRRCGRGESDRAFVSSNDGSQEECQAAQYTVLPFVALNTEESESLIFAAIRFALSRVSWTGGWKGATGAHFGAQPTVTYRNPASLIVAKTLLQGADR